MCKTHRTAPQNRIIPCTVQPASRRRSPDVEIWGRTSSVNVQKVLWCCEELDVAHERVDAGGPFGGTRNVDYLAMNPNGLVPTISDDGFSVWESNTIVRYLSARYGGGVLWAEDPADRSLAERWMDFQLGSLWPAFRAGFLGLTRTPHEQRNPDAIKLSLRNTAEVLSILDSHLYYTEYVAGESLTMGDVALGSTDYRWSNIEIERPPMPKLEAWHERLASRRAYQRSVMVPFTLT